MSSSELSREFWLTSTFLLLVTDKLVWREVKPDKTYRRLSHSSTQVGSYLFVMGGHDGNKYSHELLLFNLGTHSSSLLVPFELFLMKMFRSLQ